MAKSAPKFILGGIILALSSALPAHAALVYSSLDGDPVGGYGDLNANNPTFGHALTLTQPGVLHDLGISIFNPNFDGNSGVILAGALYVNFYDNTTPYSFGALNLPLLGSAMISYDYGDEGLAFGYFDQETYDLSSMNINLTQNILITQRFVQTAGDALYNGLPIYNAPTVGSSPDYVYIQSDAIEGGYYAFDGFPGQFGYSITVTPGETQGGSPAIDAPAAAPAPSSAVGALALMGILGFAKLRRNFVAA